MSTVTRQSHPHIWSLFALVNATFGHVRDELSFESIGYPELALIELDVSFWSARDLLVICGILDDDSRFDLLVSTEVGSFVNHQLAM